ANRDAAGTRRGSVFQQMLGDPAVAGAAGAESDLDPTHVGGGAPTANIPRGDGDAAVTGGRRDGGAVRRKRDIVGRSILRDGQCWRLGQVRLLQRNGSA